MSDPAGHDAISELLGAYALDAVDPDEALIIEDHLRECPRCRDEVRQHREVAAQLAFVGEPAPEGLWARIAADLAPSEPEPELARLYPFHPADGAARRWRVVGGAAAAAIVVLVGALGWEVHVQADRVSKITSSFNATTSTEQAVQAALADPGSRKIALTSADGHIQVGAVLEGDGTGYLLTAPHASLPTLPADRTYQLWGVTSGQPVSLGLLGTQPTVVAFRAASTGVVELAITAEKAGGAAQPTQAPIVSGTVPPSTLS